jgi:hypothetical protein
MVAVAQLIPKDPEEQASVLTVLREHPELREFIAEASQHAEEVFPGALIHLDTVRYDEWDPPVRLIIETPMSWTEYDATVWRYIAWLRDRLGYPEDLIFVFVQRR